MLGNYWLGTNNGLLRINPATRHIRKITSVDGLVSDKTYFLSLQPSGNLYIGYPAAFNSIDTRKFELDTFTPELKIMDIRIMDQHVLWKKNEQITINPFQNYFSIQYALLNYHKSGLNSYRYILEGFDQQWHEAGTNNIATYTNLPAGNYKFKLQAANNDNIWTKESELAKIQVLAPFYRQLWFRMSCFMVAVGLIYFYYYLQKKEQSRVKSLRTQIARDLHDEVGSSLSSIRFLSQLVQNQSSNESFRVEPIMQKISQTAGNISDAMAGIIWTLQDEQPQFSHIVQRLESFGKRVVEAQGSELEIQVDPTINDLKLSFDHLKHIYLIAKEAINNSVKYGGRCKIRMSVLNENQRLHLTLSDNGVGCDLDKIKSGNGLKNIRARSQELKATCEIRSEKNQGMSIDILTDSL
jgi:signal transduction histidine kinase